MNELTTARIKAHATKLGLPHLAASLEQLVKRADTEQMGYLDFLDLIVEEEL
ncbi:AAA family ATPase, partial [Enterobacter sp. Cy-1797]|nr:AAA family ATPase [Enterobacter sp. Cy-1797]